jgi:hypothetical protein
MINQIDNPLWYKTNRLSRFLMANLAAEFLPLYIVNEYPKSGGTWVGQLLSEAFKIPFPRNRLPMLRSCILHGHSIKKRNMKNVVVVWRDARDILISQYHHCLFLQDNFNAKEVGIAKKDLKFEDNNDIQKNLMRFIKYVYEDKRIVNFSWSDFVNSWARRSDVVHVKYEDLHRDTTGELKRVVKELTGKIIELKELQRMVHKYSFKRQTGRKQGEENPKSFLRKGIVGDWKNYFTKDSKELFAQYAGEALIRMGYEKDHSWVTYD